MNTGEMHLCLSDLLDQDLSANEYFQTLSPQLQKELQNSDITSFAALQQEVQRLRNSGAGDVES